MSLGSLGERKFQRQKKISRDSKCYKHPPTIGGTMYSIGKYKATNDYGLGPSMDLMKMLRSFLQTLTNLSFLDGAIGVVIVVFLVGALVGPIANFTTGITIAHTGFTPNPNVTQSPGAAPLLQIYPLFFVIFGLVVIAKYLSGEGRGL